MSVWRVTTYVEPGLQHLRVSPAEHRESGADELKLSSARERYDTTTHHEGRPQIQRVDARASLSLSLKIVKNKKNSE